MGNPCCNKKDTNKGAWSKQEDQKLIDYIKKHGEGSWRTLPKAAGLLRCGKSCRLRWINYLRPDLRRGNFAEDEEDLIIKLHALLGNRWSLIAGRLPGRTNNEIKKYWNSHLRRKLINMGIDPNNYRSNHYCNYISLMPQQNSSTTSACATSSLLELQANEQKSNNALAASCFEDSTDLNLDLKMGISSPSFARAERDQKHNEYPNIAPRRQEELMAPGTLLLFR